VLADLAAWQYATALSGLGVVLLIVAAQLTGPKGPTALETVIQEIGALLLVTGALSVMWDVVGRRRFTAEVLEAANLSSDVRTAKLAQLTDNYHDIAWDDLLNGATQVDLFFAYARTWRNTHITALRRLTERQGTSTRVVLPNPNNDELMVQLGRKFAKTEDELRDLVCEAVTEFEAVSALHGAGSTLELRFSDEFPVFTYYRFDRTAVVVMYAQAPGRADTPTIAFEEGGMLAGFFNEQFKRLWESASPIHDEQEEEFET
jgi:hypothetical protein